MLDRDDIYTLIAADRMLQEILDKYEHLTDRDVHKLARLARALLKHYAEGEDTDASESLMTVDDARFLTKILALIDRINRDYDYPNDNILDLIEVAYGEGREIRQDDPKLKQKLQALQENLDDVSP